MNIAILGYGSQGQAAFDYWNTPEHMITICDVNTELTVPSGAEAKLGDDYLNDLDQFDLLIRTPILHPRAIVEANPQAPQILDKVTTVTNEFIRVCPSRNIIGVTGTKGKGTTSTLLSKILEAAGKRVHLGGNIGLPPLNMLRGEGALDGNTQLGIQPEDWVVLELANFQLIDLKHSPHIAVCLMVEPEHMDWHEDVEEYIAAKQQLFIHQNSDDVAIYYANNENSISIADASEGTLIPYFESPGAYIKDGSVMINDTAICTVEEIKLLGRHNWQNVCAAVTAAWQVTQDAPAIRSAVTTFSGLPFRIELRGEVRGIRYYNDSFATGPGAAIAAINSVPGMKVLIIGGYDRMLDLTELSEAIIHNETAIRKVILIGASADRTAEKLSKHGYNNFTFCREKDMKRIVEAATAEAISGDAVVLSPSFASFDMFKNFEDRGNKFNEAVAAL